MDKTLYIYTDASLRKNELGMGVLFIDGEIETRFQYRTTISWLNKEYKSSVKVSIQYGETFAILKALENLPKTKFDKYVIFTDNTSVFDNLNSIKTKKDKVSKDKLLSGLTNKCLELMKDLNIEICWIKAHCGVFGNEVADKIAKGAITNKIPCCNENRGHKWALDLLDFEFHMTFNLLHVPGLDHCLDQRFKETLNFK